MKDFFFVQRGIQEVIYHLGTHEIEIKLSDDWNKSVKKFNEICEVERELMMCPELRLRTLQTR